MKSVKKHITPKLLLLSILFCVFSCSVAKKASVTPAISNEIVYTDAGRTVSVTALVENIRRTPNGQVVGKLRSGDELTVIKKVGNWVNFQHNRYGFVWAWAPSLGYDYLNLYNPSVYFDANEKLFYNIDYFKRIFSSNGEIRQDFTTTYEVFFGDIGLGNHEAQILNVAEVSEEVVKQGVTIFVRRNPDMIYKIKVDYFKPINGIENALQKSELPVVNPDITNEGHIIWNANTMIDGLIVDLERREWESFDFSGIWFMLPE